MQRFINLLFALDCFLFSVCTLGGAYPFESFSSAAYRSELMGGFYGRVARPLIDWLASPWQAAHCRTAYYRAKLNLPGDER